MNKAWAPQAIQAVAVHVIMCYSMFTGLLDEYTALVLVHAACLMAGPQLHHLFHYGRPALHRRVYVANTLAISLELVILGVWPKFSGRNLGLCPALQTAFTEFYKRTSGITYLLFSFIFLLSFLDVLISQIDGYRNRGIKRGDGRHHKHFRPRWLTWELHKNQRQRLIWSILGFTLFALTIFVIEWYTVKRFQIHMANNAIAFTGINQWLWGQISALGLGLWQMISRIRPFFIKKLLPWAVEAKCKTN
jgi:hypothetical protein